MTKAMSPGMRHTENFCGGMLQLVAKRKKKKAQLISASTKATKIVSYLRCADVTIIKRTQCFHWIYNQILRID